jgi:hypothetical protein
VSLKLYIHDEGETKGKTTGSPQIVFLNYCKLKLDMHGEGETKGITTGSSQIVFLSKLQAEDGHTW